MRSPSLFWAIAQWWAAGFYNDDDRAEVRSTWPSEIANRGRARVRQDELMDDQAGDEPSVHAPLGEGPTRRAVLCSFALSLLGGLLFLLPLSFVLSPALFFSAAALARPIADRGAARQLKRLGRVALATAIAGLFMYAVFLAAWTLRAPEIGARLLAVSALLLFVPLSLWSLWRK